jgi:aminopeptidase N
MMKRTWTLAVVLCTVAGCQTMPPPSTTTPTTPPLTTPAAVTADPHSYARPAEARVEHLTLDLSTDFVRKQLAGTATLRIWRAPSAQKLILDTRDLTIKRVLINDSAGPGTPATGTPTTFRLGEAKPIFGAPLEIDLGPNTRTVTVEYATSPSAAALQWLEPPQTAGKRHPFLLSQSQSILARTWVPIQDGPGVRFTYDATIRVPKDLLAVMSAENPTEKNAEGVFRFRMPQPIPSYLLAISVGDIAFRPIGTNTGVYAEVPVVDAAAREFADLPRMMEAAEELYGPYRWGRYDVLVLPPSFPFGGMENPRLTFLTPTLIAGDRSLVSVVAHELAHSWSGNLVTNATWNDFWLNEGFTTYIERRIAEKLYGRDHAEMLWTLGVKDVRDDFERLPPEDERLVLELEGRDPDEGASQVPYEKGALFLRLIEEKVGRANFDRFLRNYFDEFAFKPMTTDRFMELLRARVLAPAGVSEESLTVNAWLHEPGLPANMPQPRSEAFAKVESQARTFLDGARASTLDTTGWTTQEWLHFIHALPKGMSVDRMRDLDQRFRFSESGNAEILSAWLELAIQNRYEGAYPALERFLTSQGRRKFLRPLFMKLAETPEGMELGRRIYAKARPTYHSVSVQTVDEILKWQ